MLDVFKDDYNWEEAFKYGAPDWVVGSGREKEKAAPFDREDVAEVFGIEEGENDGDSWAVVGRLTDGRFFFLTAWCDYTGWDCQAGGRAYVGETHQQILQMAMDATERRRLFPTQCAEHEDCIAHPELGAACRASQSESPAGSEK